METTVTIDGKEVKFRATAAVPRLYRIKFGRDIIQDINAVKQALDKKKAESQDEAGTISALPVATLEIFENIAYIMAKHADKEAVPASPDEWLDGFNTFSIYGVFPVICYLWEGNMEGLVEAKKKLAQLTGR